jgi:hypothetical protein
MMNEERKAQTGVLIGETGDLRQRIKQYVTGTQECGNKYWREQFLTKGDIHLYVLDSARFRFNGPQFSWDLCDLSGNNVRFGATTGVARSLLRIRGRIL